MSSGISRSCVSRTLFPLKSISDVVDFFRKCLETPFADGEPDLTLLSIVAGFVEISLTTGKLAVAAVTQNSASSALDPADAKCTKFPVVTYEMVNSLYTKYQNILTLVQKPKSGRYANRDVIKSVSDIIWHSLFWSSQKDRAHLQNLYSYLSFNKLDSFGAALGVVAGCQLLGYKDVHLAISEDHAWVVFGKKRQEAVEVTWHGKGSNHKRGQNISAGIDAKTWLYLGGMPVICDRYMEVASIVSAINISLTPSVDCLEVAELQQRLLWLLYDMGHLDKYPMALGNLGELEEVCPTPGKKSCEALYVEAIESAKLYYKNQHVYPYTYQGTYYNRLGKYREAFRSWANAGDVIRLYTYSCRDDEEVYKEFSEIANELIPYIMKTESSGHSGRSVLRDSEVFANILRFYDGICQWEEDSLTPILHIGWAKPLVNTISKFDHDVRSQVFIEVQEINKDGDKSTNDAKKHVTPSDNKLVEGNNNSINCNKKSTFANDKNEKKNEMPTTLADLTAACGEKILNPDFLLQGGGQLFATDSKNSAARENAVSTQDVSILKKPTLTPILDPLPEVNVTLPVSTVPPNISPNEFDYEFMPKQPIVHLYSRKMLGLNKLLLAEKLNTHAILLQVTAQSVSHRKCRGMEKSSISPNHTNVQAEETSLIGTRSKRTRRE